eukprot:comp5387_c0_seq1/m.1369 comp5387_c0_seq1/g.1369  ORF comp5387_c0_seq1/g.1369 comp5387_c0_seq1/m.1369 type:complete len:348 (-) comp5387_c0_seq1:593-1636(-)
MVPHMALAFLFGCLCGSYLFPFVSVNYTVVLLTSVVLLVVHVLMRGKTANTGSVEDKDEAVAAGFDSLQSRLAVMYDVETSQRMLLNLQPPTTWWMNFGYWEKGHLEREGPRAFVSACESLARKLGQAADLQPNDTCLDVGNGCGDQDLLWHREFGVTKVCAMDLASSQVRIAKKRFAETGIEGDVKVAGAPNLPWPDECFTKVLSLDSAYHYDTREDFFVEAFRVLKPGGILALADIVSGDEYSIVGLKIAKFLFWMGGSPTANFHNLEIYRRQLMAAGFTDVQIVDISDKVFPGLPSFVPAHRAIFGPITWPPAWFIFRTAAYFLTLAHTTKSFKYVLVSARKPT